MRFLHLTIGSDARKVRINFDQVAWYDASEENVGGTDVFFPRDDEPFNVIETPEAIDVMLQQKEEW